jgi:putative ABC transport system permease protein
LNQALQSEIRYSFRSVMRRPAFSIGIILTLALVIGASTGIFSAIYGIMLRRLPYQNPNRLVFISESNHATGTMHLGVTMGAFPIIASASQSFDSVAACGLMPRGKNADYKMFSGHLWGTQESVTTAACSSQVFRTLGVSALIGRAFPVEAATDRPTGPTEVVLNYRFWRSHFGGDPNVVGKTLSLDDFGEREDLTIIGVMPENFEYPYPFTSEKLDCWVRLYHPTKFIPGNILAVIARLRPGVKIGQAQAELASLGTRLRAEYSKYFANEYLDIEPLQSELVRDVRTIVWALLAALGSVLLVGCSNIGCLLLVHAGRRQKEMAVRAALGASRFALIRQMSSETLLLAVIGGALGLGLAAFGVRLIIFLLPASIYVPRLDTVVLDTRILAVSAGVSALVALAFGILPALKYSKANITEELKTSDMNPGRSVLFRRSGSVLIVFEVSLALVLATSTLMLTKSVRRFLATNAEFQPEHFLSLEITFTNAYLRRTPNFDELAPVFYSQFRQKVEAMPGVRSVTFLDGFPMLSPHEDFNKVKETGGEGPISEAFQPCGVHTVDASYIEWARFEIVRGRWLSDSDGPKDLPVAVINSAMERLYFPRADALGARIEPFWRETDKAQLYTVVGVIQEPKRFGTGLDADPAIFLSMQQSETSHHSVLIRTFGNPSALSNAVRDAALAIVPGEMLVGRLRTGEDTLSESTARARFLGMLLSAFSGLALVLTLVGTYALVSYDTARRTREVGIRMALGATAGRVERMVVLGTTYPIVAGVALGAVATYGFARTLSSLLYGVSPADLGSFGLGAIAILIVAAIASYIPARRASRIDPLEALRHE